MHEYIEEIPKEKLMTAEGARQALIDFMTNLFKELGYEMGITFRDDFKKGVRIARARWTDKEEIGDGGGV